MIQRQLMAVLAVVVAVTFTTGTVQGKPGQGIFEAPMVDVNPGPNFEVAGSEGKIEREGEFKVEIPGVPAGTYRVCLFHDDAVSRFLGEVVVDEDGELKLEGNLTTAPTTPPVVAGEVLVQPDFRVFLGAGTDCTGAPEFRSGLRVGATAESPAAQRGRR